MSGLKMFLMVFIMMFVVTASVYAADCNTGGRYEDMGDGTVQDCRTGLIWLTDANCTDSLGLPGIDKSPGYLTWYKAMKWVAVLGSGHCALTDGSYAGEWRLPTITEWRAMIASAKKQGFSDPILTNAAGTAKWTTNGDAFSNVQSDGYWSSTTYAPNTAYAWYVDMLDGYVVGHYKASLNYYVWPVRGGQSGSFGNLIIE